MRAAIIFPNEAKLQDLNGWLAPYAANNQMMSFMSLRQAIPILRKAPCDFVLTGDRFPEAQGKLLLKGLRKLCPSAQILMLADQERVLEDLVLETHTDLNTHYFRQPWDTQSLMAHVEAAIGMESPPYMIAIVLDEKQASEVSKTLENLQNETGATSTYLVTNLGQVLDHKGSELEAIGEISSLLGGSFAALNQLKQVFGKSHSADNLLHQRGDEEDIYAFSIGDSAVLMLRFLHGVSNPRIGIVSFYARRSVEKLEGILANSVKRLVLPDMEKDSKSLEADIDQLFVSETAPPHSFSYTQALRHGLVTTGLEGRFEAAQSQEPTRPLAGRSTPETTNN